MFKWFYLALAFFPISEALLYPGVIFNYLKIKPLWLTALFFLTLLVIKIYKKPKNSHFLAELGIYKLAPLTTILALLLRAVELFNYPNFVYSHFHISPSEIGLLALHIWIISLALVNWQKLRHNYQQNWFVISLFSLHLLLIYWLNPAWFYSINSEDQFIEYLTSVIFLVGSLISFYNLKIINSLKLKPGAKTLLFLAIFGLGLFLFMIAGEEISWGQRLFNIQITEEIAQINTQNELNLHNNIYIFPFVYTGYLLINLYGLTSWLINHYFSKKLKKLPLLWLKILTTRWYYALFFLPNLIYVIARFSYGHVIIDQWEELSEIYLAMGILVVIIHHFLYFKAHSKKGGTLVN